MTGRPREVVLLGKGELAIRIGEWFATTPGYRIVAVVPVVPEPSWTPSLSAWARHRELAVVENGQYEAIRQLADSEWRADLAMSVFYDRIIGPNFIARCRRILNLHNGPLPRYRGVSPINWALKNEERMHGVTIHEITPGIDDGPIVAQVIFSIYPQLDEVIDVYRRCLDFGWTLFTHTMPRLDMIVPQEQDHEAASYYSARQNASLGDRRYFTRGESQARMPAREMV
jgi:methionyl-tRNA formyltransferase